MTYFCCCLLPLHSQYTSSPVRCFFFFRFVLTFVLCVCGYGAIGIRCGKTVPVVDMSIRCELIWKKNTTEIGKREREGGREKQTLNNINFLHFDSLPISRLFFGSSSALLLLFIIIFFGIFYFFSLYYCECMFVAGQTDRQTDGVVVPKGHTHTKRASSVAPQTKQQHHWCSLFTCSPKYQNEKKKIKNVRNNAERLSIKRAKLL